VIIHAGDMPQHGRRFHSGFPDTYEDFNDRDPRGLRIEDLLGSIKSKKINYFFGKITKHTDKMIEVTFFETVYGQNIFCILISPSVCHGQSLPPQHILLPNLAFLQGRITKTMDILN
jgi:hypothetical protein